METTKLKTILDDHKLWLENKRGTWANLNGANLNEAVGIKYAQVSWTGHGECGRQLLAVELPDGIKLFCGCFSGTPSDLKTYIATGSEKYYESRTKAMEFVLSCF